MADSPDDDTCALVRDAIAELTRHNAYCKTNVAAINTYIEMFHCVALGPVRARAAIAALPPAVGARVTDAVVVPPPVAAPAPAAHQAPRRVTITLVLDLAPGADAGVVRAHVTPASHEVRVGTDFRGDDETLPLHVFVARRP